MKNKIAMRRKHLLCSFYFWRKWRNWWISWCAIFYERNETNPFEILDAFLLPRPLSLLFDYEVIEVLHCTPPTTKATALHHLVVSCLLPLKTDFRTAKDGPHVGCDLLVHFRVCWKYIHRNFWFFSECGNKHFPGQTRQVDTTPFSQWYKKTIYNLVWNLIYCFFFVHSTINNSSLLIIVPVFRPLLLRIWKEQWVQEW